MSNMEKVQTYLNDLQIPVDKVDHENTLFVVQDPDRRFNNLFIDVESPVVVVHQVLGKMKDPKSVEALTKLLEANATMVHGAFCVDADSVVSFRDTLAVENLDCNELESTLNALSLAMAENSNDLIDILK